MASFDLPRELLHRPFAREEAEAMRVPRRFFDAGHFVRLYPRVWRHRSLLMTPAMHIAAARLALPEDARVTSITRLQQLGLGQGGTHPLHFVVGRDHHVRVGGVFLHRTHQMPPSDGEGVEPFAAFVAYCSHALTIEAIKAGDWLIQNGHTTAQQIGTFVSDQPLRDGANEAAWLLQHVDGSAESLMESELRALITFAGLPLPQSNVELLLGRKRLRADLWFDLFRVAIEYEGSHHQTDRHQYLHDIDRYALMRDHNISYIQVTKEKLANPLALLKEIHGALKARGYTGVLVGRNEIFPMLYGPLSRATGPNPARGAVRRHAS